MLLTRTPLRISLGGGGTDLPSYADVHGGFVLSAAIDKYVYVGVNKTWDGQYLIKYSALERVKTVAEIKHPFVRAALERHDVGPSEIVSLADIPAGTGLGSSGTFAVGLLRALRAVKRAPVDTAALAEEACRIELEQLGRPVGRQDPYIAAFGGLTCFEFRDGTVTVSPLAISSHTLYDLEEHLLLFFTGRSRSAGAVLADQKTRSEANDATMLDSLHATKALGLESKRALEAGDTRRFAALMHDHWRAKRQRSPGISDAAIDRWYDVGLEHGALGGKLVGAGGGGFLLFYARDKAALRQEMAREGLTEVRFSFDHDGSVVLARG
jgi:D-glycero-alpha-D-manno-heptose-7-phosphate kinase